MHVLFKMNKKYLILVFGILVLVSLIYFVGSIYWDISTASYNGGYMEFAFDTAINPYSIFFSSDGSKMFGIGATNQMIRVYTLSTPWLISSATYDPTESFNPPDWGQDIFFNSDGTKFYYLENTNELIYQYNLSMAWNVSTATYSSNFSIATEEIGAGGLFINSDGENFFIVGGNDVLYQYSFSTPWDLSSATFDNVNFSVGTEETDVSDLFLVLMEVIFI